MRLNPALTEKFRAASPDRRRAAALAACEAAVRATRIEDERVARALAQLRAAVHRAIVAIDPRLRADVEQLSALLDDESFAQEERGRASDDRDYFSQARAAAAVAYALSGDSEELHEAIYEALHSVDDTSEIVRGVETALN
jgi:type I site-specific restriction endonuclease